MLEKIEQIREEAQESLTALSTMDELEAWRLRYLGKKGVVTLALRSIGDLPREERPAAGRLANQVQRELAEAFEKRREEIHQLEVERELAQGALDVSIIPNHSVSSCRARPIATSRSRRAASRCSTKLRGWWLVAMSP